MFGHQTFPVCPGPWAYCPHLSVTKTEIFKLEEFENAGRLHFSVDGNVLKTGLVENDDVTVSPDRVSTQNER